MNDQRLGFLSILLLGTSLAAQVPVANLSGIVSDSTVGPLRANFVYHASTNLTVPAGQTLTIEPGAVLKFGSEVRGLQLEVHGTLRCNGTASAPVIFTSDRDDATGGDTPGNGPSSGSPGDWRGLRLMPTSDGSVIDHAVVRCFGNSGNAGFQLFDADVTLNGCLIERGSEEGIDLTFTTRGATVANCEIRDNAELAISHAPLQCVPGFSNNLAARNAWGDYIRVEEGTITADATITPDNVLNGALVMATDVLVTGGATLTFESGVVTKWNRTDLDVVDGALRCNGTVADPVVFTAFADDSIGGDTNGDGPSVGAAGDWSGVVLRDGADQSVLTNTRFRFGGLGGFAALELRDAAATIDRCTVTEFAGEALDLNLTTTGASIIGCSLNDNGGEAVANVPLAAVPGFQGNSAAGNAGGDYLAIRNGVVSGDVTIVPGNVLNGALVVTGTPVVVAAGAALNLEAGVTIKWQAGQELLVEGSLNLLGTAFDPVVLTSIDDDRFAGDTDGDGDATPPAPGAWWGVRYVATAATSDVRHALIRYAGANLRDGLRLGSAEVSVSSVRVEHCSHEGIRVDALAGDAPNWVVFDCRGGIELTGGSSDLAHATVANNRGVGVRKLGGFTGRVVNSIAWGNGGGNFVGFAAGDVRFSNGDPALAETAGNIFADPAFVDPTAAVGDLRLSASSPGLDAAEPAPALAVIKDHDERPRALDHGLSGSMLPDMGAFERGVWSLAVSGRAAPGETLEFTVSGSTAGVSLYVFGTGEGALLLPPYGVLLLDTRSLIPVLTLPTGAPLSIPIPGDDRLLGFAFAIQALTVSADDPTRGNLSALYRTTIRR